MMMMMIVCFDSWPAAGFPNLGMRLYVLGLRMRVRVRVRVTVRVRVRVRVTVRVSESESKSESENESEHYVLAPYIISVIWFSAKTVKTTNFATPSSRNLAVSVSLPEGG